MKKTMSKSDNLSKQNFTLLLWNVAALKFLKNLEENYLITALLAEYGLSYFF